MQQHHKKHPVRTEYSAGGIVFRRTPRGPEIAFVKDSVKKWTFPKGHIAHGERVEHTAVRESAEEMGLRGLRAVRRVGKIDIWFRDRYVHKGTLIHKYIYYVLVEAQPGAQLRRPPIPKRGEPIYAVRWVPLRSALRFSNYKDVLPVLRRAIDIIQRNEYPRTRRA